MKKKYIPIIFIIVSLLLIAAAGILYFYPYKDGYERQNKEESIARSYLEDLQLQQMNVAETVAVEPLNTDEQETESEEEPDSLNTKETWSDDAYYEKDGIVYTPEYAAGTIDCVLIIPEIEMCRGVYTGTWSDISHNLDVWMATTARPDYVLGETHYCIYGHNTPRLNLSFNRLQSLSEGSVFYLVNQDGVYQYQVTDILGVSRSDSTRYTDDFSIGSEMCYLITCGRNEYRYLDLIVEGTLDSVTAVNEADLEALFSE